MTVHDGPETVYIKDTTITVTQSSTLYAGTTPTENLTVAKSATWVVGTFYDSNLADVPADFSGTIAWGDSSSNLFGKSNVTLVGAVVNPSGLPAGTYNEFTVTGTHAYSATGTYAVNVTINDIDAVSVTATSSAIVNYASGTTPVGSSHDSYISGVKGSPATLNSATFTDASKAPASDFIVTAVNWGDPSDPNNTSTAGLTVTETSPGNYLVSGAHTYPGPGTFPYSITVENTLSGNSTTPPITGTARISDTHITAFASAVPQVTENVQFGPVELAYFTDADASAPITDYTATVYWGDGTMSVITSATTLSTYGQIVASGGGFQVMGVHTYNSTSVVDQTYHVKIVITDKVPQANGGSYATVYTTIVDPPAGKSSTASVNDAALMAIYGGSNEGPAPA